MAEAQSFEVTFWGVRGSIACAGPDYARYGGNTSCVAMRCGGRHLIFDAGTGLRPLGERLCQLDGGCGELDLFLTHTHFDHVVGLPFFKPMFVESQVVRLWAGHLTPEMTLHEVLCEMMMAPLFPIPPDVFAAEVEYLDFSAGKTLEPGNGIRIATAPLNHPNRATSYRVDFDGRSACYVTDTEHREGERDQNILDLVEGTDLLIYDSSYTDREYPKYRGWGHSTWQEGVRLAEAADVHRLVLFHHDPSHDDRRMDEIAAAAAEARPGTVAAAEGMTISL